MSYRRISLFFAAVVSIAALAAPAVAAMNEAELKKHLEQLSGGATVLKVEPVKIGGQDAYKVRMMNPGGNDNGAFQVYTVVVDAVTGMPISESRLGALNE